MPTYQTFKNYTESLYKPLVTKMREGRKAFEDKWLATCIINYENMKSNDWFVADHHIFDVLVEHDDKIIHPWLSGWQDKRSRKIVGYVISFVQSPNSNIVVESFANAVFNHGIPENVHLDNGKDYKAYDVFNKDYVMSISNKLQIKVTNALPYNAKAKPIERLFKTLEEKYCIFLPSYVGNDPKNRPEKLSVTNKKVLEQGLAMKSEDFIMFVEKMIISYNNTPHTGQGMHGKSPNEVYIENLDNPRLIKTEHEKAMTAMLLTRSPKAITVGKNGVRVRMDSRTSFYYDCDYLLTMRGKPIVVHYNSNDNEKVYIYTPSQEYVCTAYKVDMPVLDGSDSDKAAIKAKQHKNKIINANIRNMKPSIQTPSIDDYFIDCGTGEVTEISSERAKPFNPSELKAENLKNILGDKQKQKQSKNKVISPLGYTR